MKTVRNFILLALVLALGAGFLFLGHPLANGSMPAPSIRTVTVDSGPVTVSIRATGRVDSPRNVRVGATIGGRVAEVRVDLGSAVARGQRLARLDTQEASLQLAADRLEVAGIETEIAQQERALRVVRADYQAGAEPREKVTQVEEVLALSQIRLRKAAAKVNLSQLRIEESVVAAPIAGIVSQLNVQPGEVVTAGATLLTLVDPRTLEILAHMEQADALHIRPGMVARVSIDGAPEPVVQERVLRIEPAVRKESNGDFLAVWISLTPSALHLRPNQQVDVRLLADDRGAVARLPQEAVLTANGKASVWTVHEGRLHAVPVQLGSLGDRHVEILSGVRPGQEVAIVEGRGLKEGDAVTVARPGGR